MSHFSSGESDKIPEGQQTVLERFVQACEADRGLLRPFWVGLEAQGSMTSGRTWMSTW